MLVGTLLNVAAIALGSGLGWLLRRAITERFRQTLMSGLGLCTLSLGILGVTEGREPVLIVLSILIGALLGEAGRLEELLEEGARRLEERWAAGNGSTLARGLVSATLLFCVGSLTIVGSLQDGLSGDYTLLALKSALDFTSSLFLCAALGWGVALAIVPVALIQGSITLSAMWLAPYLTAGVVQELNCVGSVLIVGLGLNILEVAHLKIANYLPALLLVPLLYPLVKYLF